MTERCASCGQFIAAEDVVAVHLEPEAGYEPELLCKACSERTEAATLDPDVVFTALTDSETLDEAERKALREE